MASIYSSRNGRWTAQVNVGGTRNSKTFTSQAEAKRWARQSEAAADRGVVAAGRELKFANLLDAYVNDLSDVAPSKSKLAALGVIREELGRRPLRNMSATVFREFAAARAEGGAGPSTIMQDLSYVGTILRHGGGLLELDTTVAVAALVSARQILRSKGAVSRSTERNRRPTEDELIKLQDFWAKRLRGIDMWSLTLFAIATAMRLAEICRITWADLDETNRTVTIRDRKHPRAKKGNDQVVPLLRGHVTIGGEAIDPMALILARKALRRNEAEIFPFDPKTISTNFTRGVAASAIDDLHFHDLRHDGVSRMFAAGYTIEQVSLVSGHKDWNMLRRYTQLKAEDLHRD